jgi:hypothetical protein
MPMIPIVENPSRKHRRRLTAKQIAYGFGGKRRRTKRPSRKRKPALDSRKRNPSLATLSGLGNPRRRRSHARRYRNPGMLGGITNLIDLKGAMYVTGGIAISKIGPKLLSKFWTGAPTSGIGLYAVKLGMTLAGATAVKMFLRSDSGARLVAVGGIAEIAYGLLSEYALPAMGLAGLGDENVSTYDLQRLQGFVPSATRLEGFTSVIGQPELSY